MDWNIETDKDKIIVDKLNKKPVFTSFDLVVASVSLVFCIGFLVYPVISENKKLDMVAEVEASEKIQINPFTKVNLQAAAAYVLDLKSGKVFFEKNSEAQLPLASLTKIMTAVSALSVVPESTIVTISKDDLELEGDSGLFADERWRLADLLGLTLVESSNDGAYAVASSVGAVISGSEDKFIGREAFINLMNDKAKELGLSQTYFNNSTGLDEDPNKSGGYGSARDIAQLIGYAALKYPEIFSNTKYSSLKVESLNAPSHTAINTNKDLGGIPVIVASKTGFTDLAGGNLAIIFNPSLDDPIAVVVLGSTIDGRFEDVKNLAWAAIDSLAFEK